MNDGEVVFVERALAAFQVEKISGDHNTSHSITSRVVDSSANFGANAAVTRCLQRDGALAKVADQFSVRGVPK